MIPFDPTSRISKYFTYREALWLQSWERIATEADGLNDDALDALERFFKTRMDAVRGAVNVPIRVHVAYRPAAYNLLVKGAASSCHMARKDPTYGLVAACDWSCDLGAKALGDNCDRARALLLPKLEALNIRMEDNGPGSPWVHIDNRLPGPGGRYFKP